jgi:hypothetical protein
LEGRTNNSAAFFILWHFYKVDTERYILARKKRVKVY